MYFDIDISLKFVFDVPIDNKTALLLLMVVTTSKKPLLEPMLAKIHIVKWCVSL